MEKREGQVKDLVERIERGEITPKKIVSKLKESRELKYKTPMWNYFCGLIWGALCFLPAIAKFSRLGILSFFTRLSAIEFPAIVIYLSIIIFIVAVFLTAWGIYFRIKKGGLHSEDDTIILLKNGPYRIVRHSSDLALTIFFITIPIFLSKYVPFTILSVIGIAEIIASNYYISIKEEELNLRKWGDEYRQYMKEVPRWNIIKGLWNLRKNR